MAKKIDPKLDHFFDVSWDRCLGGIWLIFGAKMEPSWHQNGIKNRCLLGRTIFLKSCSGCSGGSIFQDLWVQIGSKHRPKTDQKMESKMECILASIFERFCWILGAKLGGKIDQKSIKNHIEKTMQKTKPFGTRLGPSSGCQGRRHVLRPNAARPNATQRAENPLRRGRQGSRTSRKNIPVKNNKSYVF